MSELKTLLQESKGLPSAFRKDHPIGTVWAGRVQRVEVRQVRDDDGNPETWDNGDPKQQVVVAIQTTQRDPERPGDDGVRGIYIKWWGAQRQALRDCLEAAGVEDIEVGGMFAAQYVGDGEQPKNKMFSPAKLMKYEYKAPSPTAGLLGGGNGSVAQTPPPPPPPPRHRRTTGRGGADHPGCGGQHVRRHPDGDQYCHTSAHCCDSNARRSHTSPDGGRGGGRPGARGRPDRPGGAAGQRQGLHRAGHDRRADRGRHRCRSARNRRRA